MKEVGRKILFLCRGNVARSVFAERLYNNMTGTDSAFSAGTSLSGKEQTLASLLPKTEFVIKAMEEEGIDVSEHTRKSVTDEMVEKADIIIDMSEPETTPDFVKEHHQRVVWEIEDPKGTDFAKHIDVKNKIKKKVRDFVGG